MMQHVFARAISLPLLALLAMFAPAQAESWRDFAIIRDDIKPDSVPGALASQGKMSVQPWAAGDRDKLIGRLETVFAAAPGLFRRGASQGPIPLYRIDQGSSFGGHGSLWLSYINTAVVAHELTHVADAEHKIVRSQQFRALVEPRIKALRAVLKEHGILDMASVEASNRSDLYRPLGLPSAYAASNIQETLAEYMRARVTLPDFDAPDDIKAFIDGWLAEVATEPDPSVARYRRGKRARLMGEYATAYAELTGAIKHDPAFAEAYIERGRTLAEFKQHNFAVPDFSAAIELMPEYDWQLYVPYQQRGRSLALQGQYLPALADLAMAKKLNPDAPGLERMIGQVKIMQAENAN